MAKQLTIGHFAKMTYLSTTALRHYHDVGLLEPAGINPVSGYRYYTTQQVPTAHVIRRLRALEMPVEQVREVLDAPDAVRRNEIIAAHLRHMERRLDETQASVASLRQLLTEPTDPPSVEYRTAASMLACSVSADIGLEGLGPWALDAFDEIASLVRPDDRRGPPSILYFPEFFEAGIGRVVAYIPAAHTSLATGRVRALEVPAAELAVALHHGPLNDLDRTYGALGTVVADAGIGDDGPIREHFLGADPQAFDPQQLLVEVAWPITHAPPSTRAEQGGAAS